MMFKLKFSNLWVGIALIAVLFLSSCSPVAAPAPTSNAPQPAKLRIVLLPILDTLPMVVAQKEGLFAKQNLEVEFISAGSAAERDQIIISGQADGMVNDAVSVLLYNKDKIQVQIVRFARVATRDFPQFMILASKQSGFSIPTDLKGVEIGISQATAIEYVTDRLLQAEGLSPTDIKTIAVPKIPDRMALLDSGELKAATLPDPLSLLAVQQGAVVILPDSKLPDVSFSTVSFRKEVIDQQPAAIHGFLAALEEATNLINSDPAKWNSLLSEQKLVPAPLLEAYQLPTYPAAGVPSQAQWDDVLAWAKQKALISTDISYTNSVTASFLP
jgi:NitT/TauT family transport system substrate-binding protein